METSGRSYAWEVERIQHQLSSADGEPSSSGRVEAEERGSADRHLRSVAHLPRSSRTGNESLPSQSAEDVTAQEEPLSSRNTGLRARPPNLLESGGNTAPTSRRARRGSIADFLGLRAGSISRDASAAPSREITMQGMTGSVPVTARRTRRASVMQSFGFSSGAAAPEAADSGAREPEATTPRAGLGKRSKSLGTNSQAVSRRASMLTLFRPSQAPEAAEGGEEGQLIRSKSSIKSRRASVMGFFRSSNTGMANVDDAVGNSSMGPRSARLARGDGATSGRNRRRSVIDILGHSSKKVFAKLMNQEFEDQFQDEAEAVEERLWFTSLADFKPLTFKYLTGRYSSAFFACSVKTGEHYILKQFEKGKMSLSDERGVRRALAFAQMLEHEHIVECCGSWEDEEALYIVEEYAIKGDVLQDSMSHPEKYTEEFMATKVVKPLLEVLVYLHSMNVIHRAIFPEYVMFAREDKLKLAHFTSAVDQRLDPPTERIHFLDYMAPEMLSVRVDDPTPLAPWGWGPGRVKTPTSQQTRVIRMAGLSNDGSVTPQQPGRSLASAHPQSPVSPSPTSPFDRRSPLSSPARRQPSTPGGDLPGLTGFPQPPTSEPSDKASPSRTGTRSPLNLFRSSRRLSPQQPLEEEPSPSSPFANRRFRSGELADAPWLIPQDSSSGGPGVGPGVAPIPAPPRRRKSVVDEMSAPWLTPLEPEKSDTDAADDAELPAVSGGGGGAAADAAAVTSDTLTGPGSGGDGLRIAAIRAGEVRTASALPLPSPPSSSAVVQIDGMGSDGTFRHSGDGGDGGRASRAGSRVSLERLLSPAEAATSSSPSPVPLTTPPPLLQGSACRRSGSDAGGCGGACRRPHSALHAGAAAASPLRPGSAFRPDPADRPPPPPNDHEECLPGYAAEAPPVRPASSLRRQGSTVQRQNSVAPPPPPQRQPSNGQRQQSTGGPPPLQGPPSVLRRQGSGIYPGIDPGPGSCSAGGGGGGLGPGSGGPGPVGESLIREPLSAAPIPQTADAVTEVTEVKRVRQGVSFTAATPTPGEDLMLAGPGEDRPSGRGGASGGGAGSAPRSRLVSREPSSSAAGGAAGGHMILGLRTMARNITAKLGQVLGARGSEQPYGPGGELTSGEYAEGAGGAWGETTPRQSLAGGGVGPGSGGPDATTIFMPNNPWEWQEQYNEKVDVWQVGCLVHEILCQCLPFEADDKLLACALILWADIVSFPDHLSPECHDFMRACLVKNPAERPSAADLLLHPWIARHGAGEVLKSVRQLREDEAASHGVSDSQQLTTLQRAAAALGLGWMVGVGPGGGAAAGGSGGTWTWSSWFPRPWTAKVAPAGAAGGGAGGGPAAGTGAGKAEEKGYEAKLDVAMAMAQEQSVLESPGGQRRSLDVETGGRRPSHQQHQNAGSSGR